MVQGLWETVHQVLIKLNMQLLYNPKILLLGVNPTGMKLHIHIRNIHVHVCAIYMSYVYTCVQHVCIYIYVINVYTHIYITNVHESS